MAHQLENDEKLKVYYQNVEGLRTKGKQDKLKENLKNCESINLYIFVETNLDKEVKDDELFDTTLYDVIRRDRQEKAVRGHGGGLLIVYPKSSIIKSINICDDFSSGIVDKKEVEDLWVTVSLTNGEHLHLCVVYLRPQCRKEYFVQFFKKLKVNFDNHRTDKFLIVGDFNFDDFRKLKAGVIKCKKQNTKLDVMSKCTNGFKQINRIHNKNDKILDMVFTNIKGSVELSTYQLVKSQDEHPPLLINLNCQRTELKIDQNIKVAEELKGLMKSFENFKITHQEEIKELRNEIKMLRGILEDEGIL